MIDKSEVDAAKAKADAEELEAKDARADADKQAADLSAQEAAEAHEKAGQ